MNFQELIGFVITVLAFWILSGKKAAPKPNDPATGPERQKQEDTLKQFLRSLKEEEEEMEEEEILPPPPPPPRPKPVTPKAYLPYTPKLAHITRSERNLNTTTHYKTIRLDKPSKAQQLVSSVKDWKKQVLLREILGPPKGF